MSGEWDARRDASGTGRDIGRADARGPSEVDYARVIHSASFRRLQGKTQILSIGEGDFYRTRLTHSLEVAQIAGGLVAELRGRSEAPLPDHARIHAIACAHDLGHPPFGHGGEVALNWCLREAGGFEGNGQTLRLLARLESFSPQDGANLTRRSLLGVLKYPAALPDLANPTLRPALVGAEMLRMIDATASAPPKGYLASEAEVVDWVLAPLSPEDRAGFVAMQPRPGKHAKTLHKSLDCSLMDLADDIAYGVHDLEDAVALALVTEAQLRAALPPDVCEGFAPGADALIAGLFGDAVARKAMIGRLVGHFITALRLQPVPEFQHPLLAWRAALLEDHLRLLEALKGFVMRHVIRSPAVQQLEVKGQTMVAAVYEALSSAPERLLPREVLARLDHDPRAIADHVASLTDAGLLRLYERLFAPRMGSVFDRL